MKQLVNSPRFFSLEENSKKEDFQKELVNGIIEDKHFVTVLMSDMNPVHIHTKDTLDTDGQPFANTSALYDKILLLVDE